MKFNLINTKQRLPAAQTSKGVSSSPQIKELKKLIVSKTNKTWQINVQINGFLLNFSNKKTRPTSFNGDDKNNFNV